MNAGCVPSRSSAARLISAGRRLIDNAAIDRTSGERFTTPWTTARFWTSDASKRMQVHRHKSVADILTHVQQKYRVGLYLHASDPQLAANQRAALRRYAENMGWTITIEIAGEIEPLIQAADEHAIQLVLCWRLSDMTDAELLSTRLHTAGVDLLPLAQSCAALQE